MQMGKIYFSASSMGFYPEALMSDYESGSGWPSDAVEITKEQWIEYAGNPPSGKTLGSSSGAPCWVDSPPPSKEDLIAEAEEKKSKLRSVADSEISWRQDAVDAGMATTQEITALAEWKKYRVLLMRVDTTAPIWPTVPGESAS